MLAQNAGVPELRLRRVFRPTFICGDQLLVGKRCLRIAVEHPHVAVARRAIRVEINFFHVLAVVPLRTRHAEKPLLQKRIAPVPERERQTESLFEIADAANSIFAPAKRAGARLLVRKIIPGVPIGAVILAHGSPGPLGEVWPPKMPALVLSVFGQALVLGVHKNRLPVKNRKSAIEIAVIPTRWCSAASSRCRSRHGLPL